MVFKGSGRDRQRGKSCSLVSWAQKLVANLAPSDIARTKQYGAQYHRRGSLVSLCDVCLCGSVGEASVVKGLQDDGWRHGKCGGIRVICKANACMPVTSEHGIRKVVWCTHIVSGGRL